MNDEKVYIIIPVYNRKNFTRICLNAFKRQTYQNFRIVIIDDGSTDGTGEMLRNEFPDVIVIKGDGNLFWTKAMNLGVKFALENKAEYILAINNDVIPYNDYLEKMIFWSMQYPNALLGSYSIDAKTKLPIYGGEIINWKTAKTKYLINSSITNNQKRLQKSTGLPGRGLLIKAEVFNKIGLFYEKRLKHYLADYDFTMRAAKAGFELFCNYDSILEIFPEESGGRNYIRNKSLRNYFNHIFSIKGAGNVFDFYKFAIKNCPRKYLLLFLPIGIIRRMGGYLRDWILKK